MDRHEGPHDREDVADIGGGAVARPVRRIPDVFDWPDRPNRPFVGDVCVRDPYAMAVRLATDDLRELRSAGSAVPSPRRSRVDIERALGSETDRYTGRQRRRSGGLRRRVSGFPIPQISLVKSRNEARFVIGSIGTGPRRNPPPILYSGTGTTGRRRPGRCCGSVATGLSRYTQSRRRRPRGRDRP